MSAHFSATAQGLFLLEQGIIRKRGSYKQENTGMQTKETNDRGGSDENLPWSVTVIDEGVWECENGYSSEVI